MGTLSFIVAAAVAVVLLGLLSATLMRPAVAVWPPPGPGHWQYYAFWGLFRGLNILCFVVAVTNREALLGLPIWLSALAAFVLIASVALFFYSFRVLGRDNSYGAEDGLVTRGIYQWSRNPQNAMLIVVYGALAIAADNGRALLVCAAMMAVYAMMVLLEEPWLRARYGVSYESYCRAVPRFFNWRRLLDVLAGRRLSGGGGR